LSPKKLAKKIKQTRYSTFLYYITGIAQMDPEHTNQLLQHLDKEYLFQMAKLWHISNFCRLLFTVHVAQMISDAQMLAEYADKNLDGFLRVKQVAPLKGLLELLANYLDIVPIIEENTGRFVGKILNEKKKDNIPAFVGLIHAHHPQRAYYMLKRFQQVYPDAKEVIAFCHYYFGKNLASTLQGDASQEQLILAFEIFEEIEHVTGVELTRTALDELEEMRCADRDAD
jgi:hypothetical protein